jgi:rfaE bifunctional protein kinase chain/domain
MADPMAWLDGTFERLTRARVAVFGDLALDAYWTVDNRHDEISLETALPVRRVVEQRYSLGGAANVAANVVALGVDAVMVLGLIGDDGFGYELRRRLRELNVITKGIVDGGTDWHTLVFAKPLTGDTEENRLDFGSVQAVSSATARLLAERVALAAPHVDAVVLNQQAPGSVMTRELIERLNGVIEEFPDTVFIVDSRDHPERFHGACVTINALEAARWCGAKKTAPAEHARAIQARTGQPVFVTCGAEGIVAADGEDVHVIDGVEVAPPIDPVGAGDAVTATLAAAAAVGCDVETAARLANLAAAVTVSKLRVTGTASPDEIRALAARSGR